MDLVRFLATVVAITSCATNPALAQDRVDSALVAEIASIRAIDDHTHDDPIYAERVKTWSADSPLGSPAYPDTLTLRRDNPEWIRAWRALYGYRYQDMQPAHLRELLATKKRLMLEKADQWPRYVLDAAGVDIAFVNATHLGVGQENGRFRWVPWADPLLWPFSGEKSVLGFPGGGSSIGQLQREAGVAALPASLNGYVTQIVEATLAKWSATGVVAIKFLSAYRRGIDFALVDPDVAASVYTRAMSGLPVDSPQHKSLEDYLFHEIATHAGAHRLVVQIHTGNGNGPYFNNTRANPGLLEEVLADASLRNTKFVLLHGGWPFYLTAQAMTDRPNVFTDFSAQTFYLTTHALAEVLRGWLEWHPEKVLFGTDAYSDANTPLSDYEEKQWLMTDKARRALAIALTGMLGDGEITRERAKEIAHMVMRDSSLALYRLN
jgi:hypothetical protein